MNKEVQEMMQRHKLALEDLFDAKGAPVSHVKEKMERLGAQVAYNSTPCNSGGHTTRTRSGHCLVCRPSAFGFQKRSAVSGDVYIACSRSKGYTKIGMTTEKIDTRIQKLNSRGVGGTSDWVAVLTISCTIPNKVEFKSQADLSLYKVKGIYYDETESNEIFRCSLNKAIEAVENAIVSQKAGNVRKRVLHKKFDDFQFKNLRSA